MLRVGYLRPHWLRPLGKLAGTAMASDDESQQILKSTGLSESKTVVLNHIASNPTH